MLLIRNYLRIIKALNFDEVSGNRLPDSEIERPPNAGAAFHCYPWLLVNS
jgi:hypothetical protein